MAETATQPNIEFTLDGVFEEFENSMEDAPREVYALRVRLDLVEHDYEEARLEVARHHTLIEELRDGLIFTLSELGIIDPKGSVSREPEYLDSLRTLVRQEVG